jgi:CheY-like chemotaxis protein
VVVVEDSEDIRELLVELLKASGHEVAAADNGPAGLETILEFGPEVAFVDIGLPGFDGFELARRARASGCTARLVAVTGYGQADDKRRAADSGFDEHLTKPVMDTDLQRAMAAI